MAEMTFREPSRATMRFIFEKALTSCTTEGAKREVIDAANFHEAKWGAIDQQAEKAKLEALEKPKQDAPAVEKFGIDDPRTQAVRNERRKANIKKKAAARESPKSEEGSKEAE